MNGTIIGGHQIERQGRVWLIDGGAVVTVMQSWIIKAIRDAGLDPCQWIRGETLHRILTETGIGGGHIDYAVRSEIFEKEYLTGQERDGHTDTYKYRLRYSKWIANDSEIAELLRQSQLPRGEPTRDVEGTEAEPQPPELIESDSVSLELPGEDQGLIDRLNAKKAQLLAQVQNIDECIENIRQGALVKISAQNLL